MYSKRSCSRFFVMKLQQMPHVPRPVTPEVDVDLLPVITFLAHQAEATIVLVTTDEET